MIRHVVVGFDFSEQSKAALLEAETWSERLQVPLEIVHVLLPYIPPFPEVYAAYHNPRLDEDDINAGKARLHGCLAGHPAREVVTIGLPAEELLKAGDPEALLVLGQEKHSPLAHLFLGSTTHRVLRQARCPVLIVPTLGGKPSKNGEGQPH